MENTHIEDERIQALANYLELDQEEAERISEDGDGVYSIGHSEYLVLDDEEADAKSREYILDSIWCFNPSFLAGHTNLDEDDIQAIQEKLYERANNILIKQIEDIDHFVEDAINADGRGHFLAVYDHQEIEEGKYFIYRIN